MKALALALPLLLASGCGEENHQRVLFSNCIHGNNSPEYAEAVKACADAAIKIREEKRAAAQKGGA